MLTKWGSILGLASAGRIASGGGGNTGVPLGPFADWAALPVSAQDGAVALVADLGPTSSSGLATYDAGAGQWQLLFGTFLTLADLNAFTEPKSGNALAAVGPSLDDPTSVRYQWDDPNVQWLRTPDPVEYIYSASTWGTLPTQDTIQPMDEVTVNDLGYTHSSGRGQRHGSEWRLIEGKFQSVSDMTAFDTANVVHTDAIALVKAGGGHDEQAIAYSYATNQWVRFGATTTAGYAWTLTETQLLEGTDPSGIGLVQEGDYGIFAASGGPIVVRYKVVTIAAGAGGGTRAMWIPPAAYAGTNLVLDSFALGTESDAQLAAQGLAVTETNTGTVGTTSGYTDLNAPAVGSGNSVALLTSPVITGAKKFAVMCQIRGAVSSSSGAAGLFQSSAETNTQWTLAAGAAISTSVFQLNWTTTWALANNTATTRGGGSTWPGITSTPWLLMAESGAAISDLIETRVDGAVYSTFRRNHDGAGTGTNYTAGIQAVGGTAGVTGRLQVKNYFRLVWD